MTELRFMAGMRPTAEIEAEIATLGEPAGEFQIAKLAMLEGHLEKARRRDEIQASRPEGCWCVGYGSDGRDKYCDCAEGVKAREESRAAIRAETARRRAAMWALTEVPRRFIDCSFDNFPVSERTRAVLEKVKVWAEGPEWLDDDTEPEGWAEWEDRNSSLLLYGPFGTGKTGLGVGVLRALLEIEGDAMFITVPTLLERIRATYDGKGDEAEKRLMQRVTTVPVLMLDDIGAERVTEWVAEKLFTVINARHDNLKATIFTSNLDPKQLAGHIGERTAWRIIEMCEVVKLDGPNLRDRR